MKDKSNTLFHINPYVLERLEDYLQSMPDWFREELLYNTTISINGEVDAWSNYIRDDGRIRLKKRTDGGWVSIERKQGGLIPLLFFLGAWKMNPEDDGSITDKKEVVDWLWDCLSDIYNNSPYWKGMGMNERYMELGKGLIEKQVGNRGLTSLVYNGNYDALIGFNYRLNPFKPYIDASDVNGFPNTWLWNFWARLDECIPIFFLTPQYLYKPFLNYSKESFEALKV